MGGTPRASKLYALNALLFHEPLKKINNEMSQFVTYDEYNVLHLIAEDFQWTMTLLDGCAGHVFHIVWVLSTIVQAIHTFTFTTLHITLSWKPFNVRDFCGHIQT